MRIPAIVSLALILSLCSCAHREAARPTASPDAAPEAKTPAAEIPAATTEPKPRPVVTLLDAGESPMRQLRFELEEGDAFTWYAIMEMTTRVTSGDMPLLSMPAVPILMVNELRVSSIDAQGRAVLRSSLVDVRVLENEEAPKELVAAIAENMRSMVGFESLTAMDARGFTYETEMDIPADANPMVTKMLESMRGSLDQCISPFPEEPIGVGASWSVVSTIEGEFEATQTTTMRLVGMNDEDVFLEIEVHQQALPQALASATLPPGVTGNLVSYENSSRGTTHIRLKSPIPTASEVRGVTRSAMALNSEDGVTEMDVDVEMSLRISEDADALLGGR